MTRFKSSKIIYMLLAIAIIIFAGAMFRIHNDEGIYSAQGQASAAAIAVNVSMSPASTPTIKPATTTSTPPSSPTPTTDALNLPIPFTPQAPTGNWDELHNEACEEAGAIMAKCISDR